MRTREPALSPQPAPLAHREACSTRRARHARRLARSTPNHRTGRPEQARLRSCTPTPPTMPSFARLRRPHARAVAVQVATHRLRHAPLFPSQFNPSPGLRVEGYLHDCWWPGEVVEQHHRKGFRICFDDGDTAWLVRRNVRPMLRRAPQPQRDGGRAVNVGAASAPPLPRLPIRLPHGLHHQQALDALRPILAGRDGLSLNVSAVQRQVEASLLPDMPAGWLSHHRFALLMCIERALSSDLKPVPLKRTKHRLLSTTATRDPKRPHASREQLLTKPLLRSVIQIPGTTGSGSMVSAPPPLSAFLLELAKRTMGAEDATYVLGCVASQVGVHAGRLWPVCTPAHCVRALGGCLRLR